MRPQPLGPSVDLFSWGHEACEGCAEIGGGTACERSHWGLRWSSQWGHETREGCAEVGGGTHVDGGRGLRWSSLWGHEACERCAEIDVD
eukprot:6855591-Pyramimonas_sp.AAC.1